MKCGATRSYRLNPAASRHKNPKKHYMKKTLLLAAAAVAALSSQAAISDYLNVTIDDKVVTEGATFDIELLDEYAFENLYPGQGLGNQYFADIKLENITPSNVKTTLSVNYTDHPTKAEAEADPKAWGSLQICYNGMVEGNNCLPDLNVSGTVPGSKTATYQFDNKGVDPKVEIDNRKYELTLTAEGNSLKFFVNFVKSDNSGVADIIANDGAAEFFNLQGQRVDNPEKGLYIVKQNGKTSKMVIR